MLKILRADPDDRTKEQVFLDLLEKNLRNLLYPQLKHDFAEDLIEEIIRSIRYDKEIIALING